MAQRKTERTVSQDKETSRAKHETEVGELVAGHAGVILTCRLECVVSHFDDACELCCVEYTMIVTQTSRVWRRARTCKQISINVPYGLPVRHSNNDVHYSGKR